MNAKTAEFAPVEEPLVDCHWLLLRPAGRGRGCRRRVPTGRNPSLTARRSPAGKGTTTYFGSKTGAIVGGNLKQKVGNDEYP